MAKYILTDSNNVMTTFDADTLAGSSSVQILDESGTGLPIVTLNVSNYLVQILGAGFMPPGTGTNDLLTTTAGNDLVIWDSGLLSTTTALGAPSGSRARLNNSAVSGYEQFDLGAGNDILDLTYSTAVIGGVASPGADSLAATAWGNTGNDVLAGGAGGDHLFGDGNSAGGAVTPGSDTLFGGAGNDVLFGDNGSTNVDEAVGLADRLYGGTGDDTLYGEGGNDILFDTSGANVFYGGGGNDSITGAAGVVDLAYGGAGDDLIVLAARAFGGDGNDTINNSLGGSGTLSGDAGNDTIYGGASSDTLYGGDGNDSLFDGASADTFYGGAGTDSISGGAGSDTIYVDTAVVRNIDTTIDGWDGSGAAIVSVIAPANSNFAVGVYDGGTDSIGTSDAALGITDTINLFDMGTSAPSNVFSSFLVGIQAITLTGIEAIVATAAADIINLTTVNGASHSAYTGDISIIAGAGDDVVFSGSGNDVIIGDNPAHAALLTPGNDLLFGGSGDDTIFGDYGSDGTLDPTFGGNDTIFGGFGADLLYGGVGNDTISDADGANVYGGLGSDAIFVHAQGGNFEIDGGPAADVTDGNDLVIVSGKYDVIQSFLGGGDDAYIGDIEPEGGSEGGAPLLIDIVYGGPGNDAIASYSGDDTLYGGAGEDVLWGGGGNATGNVLYGGDGTDYLYGGDSGPGDVLFGGQGTDYYEFALWQSNANQQIYDLARSGDAPDGTTNYIIIFGAFDTNETPTPDEPNPDFLANGFGVFQVSHDLEHPATINFDDGSTYVDPILLTSNGDKTWTLINQDSNFTVTFDQRDISTIALWNNDANDPNSFLYAPGTPVLTYYSWDGTTYAYTTDPL